jgi:CubicO group peptidase (beta-lactamase class C family)
MYLVIRMSRPFLMRISQVLIISIILGSLLSCRSPDQIIRVTEEGSQQLPSVLPSEVEMDGELLRHAISDLPSASEHGLRSMLIMRRGKLVLEAYWNGYDKNAQQDLRSATKSITSLLVGIAIDQKFIKGIDEPLRAYLGPVYPNAPALQQNITLEDLLTMRSGLACNDRDEGSPGQEDRMYRERDWVGYFLNLPTVSPAGQATHYCTGGAVALGRVISEASKRSVPTFADEFLFGPLGIKEAHWSDFDNHKQTDTGGHLSLRPQDMVRIGQLVLQGGTWNGHQLLPRAWIEQSTNEHTRIDGGKIYGYLWWRLLIPYHDSHVSAIFAGGNGGQYIFVVPELELVTVFTGGNYNSKKAQRPFQIMKKYILPAVQKPSSVSTKSLNEERP